MILSFNIPSVAWFRLAEAEGAMDLSLINMLWNQSVVVADEPFEKIDRFIGPYSIEILILIWWMYSELVSDDIYNMGYWRLFLWLVLIFLSI